MVRFGKLIGHGTHKNYRKTEAEYPPEQKIHQSTSTKRELAEKKLRMKNLLETLLLEVRIG